MTHLRPGILPLPLLLAVISCAANSPVTPDEGAGGGASGGGGVSGGGAGGIGRAGSPGSGGDTSGGASGEAGAIGGGGIGAGSSPAYDAGAAPDLRPLPDGAPGVCATGGYCDQTVALYRDLLAAARTCKIGAAGQCGVTVPGSIPCGCPVWVNNADGFAELQKLYQQAGCAGCKPIACPACLAPSKGVCAGRTAPGPVTDAKPARVAPPIDPAVGVCVDGNTPVPL